MIPRYTNGTSRDRVGRVRAVVSGCAAWNRQNHSRGTQPDEKPEDGRRAAVHALAEANWRAFRAHPHVIPSPHLIAAATVAMGSDPRAQFRAGLDIILAGLG